MTTEAAPPTTAATPQPAAGQAIRLQHILAPIDFSDNGRKTLRYALRLAELSGAEVTILHVVELPTDAYSWVESSGGFIAGEDIERFYADARRQAAEEVAKVETELPPHRCRLETVLRTGQPRDQIIKAARELPADLVVIGTHGYTGLKRLILGSTAEGVVRYAPCPVLVVREQERDFVE
ncbi:MAG: universal stress protein [Verrucomicrobia bacterium]|nr:universal stress protein [Verrucomicrobiota bacterium]